MLHGTKNPVKELISTVRRTYGLQILRNGVHSKQSLVGKPDIDLLSCSLIKNFSANDREILLSYGLNFENVTGYARIQVLREVFTSLRYNGEKQGTITAYVLQTFLAPLTEKLIFFAVEKNCCLSLNDTFAVIRVFRVESRRFFCHKESGLKVLHIMPVVDTSKLTVVPVKKTYK